MPDRDLPTHEVYQRGGAGNRTGPASPVQRDSATAPVMPTA